MVFETERMRLPVAAGWARRSALRCFAESPIACGRTLGAWPRLDIKPKRCGVPNMLRLCFEELLAPDYALPDPEGAADGRQGSPASRTTSHHRH